MKTCTWLDKNNWSSLNMRNNGNIYPCCVRWIPLSDNPDKYKHYNSLTLEEIQSIRQKLLDEINEGKHPECQNCNLLYETSEDNNKVGPLKNLIYHPHTLCSLNCKYCNIYTDEQRSTPIPEEYRDVYKTIKHFYDIGLLNKETFLVEFGGGEPLLLDNVAKAIEFLSDKWASPRFQFISNSTVKKRVDILISQIKNKYKNVHKELITSIDCGTRETYKKIRGADFFYDVIENLYNYATNDIFDSIILKYIFMQDFSNIDDEDIFGFLRICRYIADNQKKKFQISLDVDWTDLKKYDNGISEEILQKIAKMYYIITEEMELVHYFRSDYLSNNTKQGAELVKRIKQYAIEYKNSQKSYRDKYEINMLKPKSSGNRNQDLVLQGMQNLLSDYETLTKMQVRLEDFCSNNRGKKVLLYGAGDFAQKLIKNECMNNINILAISDCKFCSNESELFYGINKIAVNQIKDLDFDILLLMVKNPCPVMTDFKKKGLDKILENKGIMIEQLVN